LLVRSGRGEVWCVGLRGEVVRVWLMSLETFGHGRRQGWVGGARMALVVRVERLWLDVIVSIAG
jgi:hypothetical protein